MVVDSSALVAIFLAEPERHRFLEAITHAETRYLSAVNTFETSIVLEARQGEAAGAELDAFLSLANFEIVPVEGDQLQLARQAWRRFGRGRHPAGLNFGDCFAYALAKYLSEPLLAKGPKFTLTDLQIA